MRRKAFLSDEAQRAVDNSGDFPSPYLGSSFGWREEEADGQTREIWSSRFHLIVLVPHDLIENVCKAEPTMIVMISALCNQLRIEIGNASHHNSTAHPRRPTITIIVIS